MISELVSPESFRYERKFAFSCLDRHETEAVVRMHPACFSEIYRERMVNNIYLDTVTMSAYDANLAGISQRFKIRLRWYGELFGRIAEPALELKIKQGFLGGKRRYPLGSFTLDGDCSVARLQEVFAAAAMPPLLKDHLKIMRFALLNRYRRRYFLSRDGNFRITIDSDLEYYRIDGTANAFLQKTIDRARTVLELKYDAGLDEAARRITNALPVRMTKNSKYVSGVDSCAGVEY
jgi:hypothetical protein